MGLSDKDLSEKMDKVIHSLGHDYASLRTGRATPQLLDKVMVDYYGAPTPLKQVANVSIPEAREILIAPFDRNMLKDVERAIQASDLGLTPNNDGKNIRLQVPALTEERRKDLVKQAKAMAEKARVSLRNIRREMNDRIKDNKELSEDMQKHEATEVQHFTDKMVKQVDETLHRKEQEILEI
ncbi:ribosome recycling factor [Candidatus Haliotispira prima]|uniref:Ribosome-recycling factor n=1 Tax=Candidatus Haliotispira prima TaxID=3034016 RepID=A0ABY8MDN2_9SPIO|nr:ribosome recycling factor [Candidatus Haliotispira prima]